MIHYRVCTNGLLNSSYHLPSNTYAASSEVEELSSMIQDLDELMKAKRSSHLADNGSDDVSVSSYAIQSLASTPRQTVRILHRPVSKSATIRNMKKSER